VAAYIFFDIGQETDVRKEPDRMMVVFFELK